ncbi:MAG: YbaB/EbfC family nucleoid-associated protein [Hyphomicrobiales bacterium]|nr:YbaB/EbfC family nucleoid-associated protein [Hyphomicrobiales bacterium]
MRDMMGLMKQAQAMQQKMAELQGELDNVLVEGQSGGGLVKATMSAKGAMKAVSIDPSLFKPEEREMVEDLIVAAIEDARRKGEEAASEKMKALTAGLPLPPGMKLPF